MRVQSKTCTKDSHLIRDVIVDVKVNDTPTVSELTCMDVLEGMKKLIQEKPVMPCGEVFIYLDHFL